MERNTNFQFHLFLLKRSSDKNTYMNGQMYDKDII